MSADDDKTYMPDLVPRALVVGVLACTVAIAAVLCVIAFVILSAHERTYRPDGRFPERNLPAPHEVANVRQSPFQLPDTTPTIADEERGLLRTYGWVDHEKRIVRIPLDRAVDILIARDKGAQP